MPTYKDLAESGTNYRPTPWGVAKTMLYWDDADTKPDVPLPEVWATQHKDLEGHLNHPYRALF